MNVEILVSVKTRKRFRGLGLAEESDDQILNRVIDYIEFHPEYWSRKI